MKTPTKCMVCKRTLTTFDNIIPDEKTGKALCDNHSVFDNKLNGYKPKQND